MKKKRRFRYTLDFTPTKNTLKKLLLIIIYRRGIRNRRDRFEKAKAFVRKQLCLSCRARYMNNWNNDFKSINIVLCPSCQGDIRASIQREADYRASARMSAIKHNYLLRKKAIQYELELRFNKPAKVLLRKWHVKDRLSTREITEKLEKDFKIFDVSHVAISRWLDELGILRSFIPALRNRVYTGRMDYKKRIIDYKKRKIDYKRISQRKYAGIKPRIKTILIAVPKDLKNKLKAIAKKTKRTVSEVVRDIFRLSKISFAKRLPYPRWYLLQNGIKEFEHRLLKGRIKAKRGVRIILMVQRRRKA